MKANKGWLSSAMRILKNATSKSVAVKHADPVRYLQERSRGVLHRGRRDHNLLVHCSRILNKSPPGIPIVAQSGCFFSPVLRGDPRTPPGSRGEVLTRPRVVAGAAAGRQGARPPRPLRYRLRGVQPFYVTLLRQFSHQFPIYPTPAPHPKSAGGGSGVFVVCRSGSWAAGAARTPRGSNRRPWVRGAVVQAGFGGDLFPVNKLGTLLLLQICPTPLYFLLLIGMVYLKHVLLFRLPL